MSAVLSRLTKESDVETVCSGVRYSNAHRTGKGILLTAVGSGEVHILSGKRLIDTLQ